MALDSMSFSLNKFSTFRHSPKHPNAAMAVRVNSSRCLHTVADTRRKARLAIDQSATRSGLSLELDYEVLKFVEARDGVLDVLAVARMSRERRVDQGFGADDGQVSLVDH